MKGTSSENSVFERHAPKTDSSQLSTTYLRRWYPAIALFGGILMGLTPAPFNAWPLAWVALVPLWVWVGLETSRPQRSTAKPHSSPFLLPPLLWGIGYHGLALSWILDLHPLTWMGVPWLGSIAIALFAWGFITLWGAALVMIWAGALRFLCRFSGFCVPSVKSSSSTSWTIPSPLLFRLVAGTALWCSLETLWSYGPLYWTSLSYTQSPYNLPILHLGQLSGPMLVTAAIVAVNGLLAEAWLQGYRSRRLASGAFRLLPSRRYLGIAIALFLGLHLLGLGLYSRPLVQPADAALRIGLIQGNVPTRIKLFEEGVRRSLNSYVDGYNALAEQGVDAVLMPEGALPWFWVGQPGQAQNPLYQAILRQGVPAWVGTFGMQQQRITQSLFTIMGTGEIVSRYNKIKLVPLGEYIPFESVIGRLVNRLSPVESDMLPGRIDQEFDTPFGQAIAGICYESAYSSLFQQQAATGGQFILTASNNDPYRRGMMAQHHAQDVMRAIETDRWAVRATNTGLSGIVDPHGVTRWISGFRTYEVHADTIYRRQTQTPYVRWGNWITPALLVTTLIIGYVGRLR